MTMESKSGEILPMGHPGQSRQGVYIATGVRGGTEYSTGESDLSNCPVFVLIDLIGFCFTLNSLLSLCCSGTEQKPHVQFSHVK